MTVPLSDDNLKRLRQVFDLPELSGTPYELVRKLGSGGMAEVYLARDRELARLVAVKVLSLAEDNSASALRMTREARIVARLEHPGIVPIHDFGVLPDGRAFYVMKYVEGATLENYADQNHNLTDLLRVFLKVCDTIAFAHARGVFHRDLKPANIMIGSFGEALVMDWGIALVREDVDPRLHESAVDAGATTRDTAHGTILGTPAYMSPEQARGDVAAISVKSDIYSLGALLYYMLTREAPYSGESSEAIRMNVIAGTLVEPREKNSSIARPLNAICLKAMRVDPEQRYSNCAALADDIKNFLDQLPVSAYRENILERLLRFIGKNRVIVFMIVGYMLIRLLFFLRSGF
ncbi:MAG: serine/threonine-protein kinase [Candidatus Zixiibacteriota bacterium]